MSELSVYWVFTDSRFRSLLFDLPEIPEDCLYFHGEPKHQTWPTPPVRFDDDPVLPKPDIWNLSAGTTIATSLEVIERLEPFVTGSVEVLPLRNQTGDEGELSALNVVNDIDIERCMDLSLGADERERLVEDAAKGLSEHDAEELLSRLARGDPWPVLYPKFIAGCLGEPTLFTASGFPMIFCLERDDRDDSLMRRLSQFGITGVSFRKLWSSITGPEPVNLYRP